MSSGPYLVAACVALVAYSVFQARSSARALRTRRERLASRELLAEQEWFARYFADCGVNRAELIKVFTLIARAVGCGLTQLRPEDSFNGTLKHGGWSLLGPDDDDPLSDVVSHDLALVLADRARARAVVERIKDEPTLMMFAYALASTASESSREPVAEASPPTWMYTER